MNSSLNQHKDGHPPIATSSRAEHAASPMSVGRFVISLDFELFWGVHDNKTIEGYGQALRGGREAVARMLALFERHEIEATWATVGLLFFENAEEAADCLPANRPRYENQRLDSFKVLETLGRDPAMNEFLFAKDLIRDIQQRPGQEIGTHTFCHYYCWDDGNDEQAFADDLAAACEAAARMGIEIKSLVLPRNQIKKSYLPICRRHGITSFRDHPNLKPYAAGDSKWMRQIRRGRRIADSFVKAVPSHLQKPSCVSGEPVSIVGSRFLRADAVRSPILLKLHARRIKDEMTRVAKEGGVFHLWWHPHNFGLQLDAKMAFLEGIIEHYHELRAQYGLVSSNMGKLADLCLAEQNQMSTSFTPTADGSQSGLEACSLT